MGRKPRNYVGEAVVRLPKAVKKKVKPLIKQGQTRGAKGRQELGEKVNSLIWGRKRGRRKRR